MTDTIDIKHITAWDDTDVTYHCACSWVGGDPDFHGKRRTCPACWHHDRKRVDVYVWTPDLDDADISDEERALAQWIEFYVCAYGDAPTDSLVAAFVSGFVEPETVPPCALAMGCLCAFHAADGDANAPCNTDEVYLIGERDDEETEEEEHFDPLRPLGAATDEELYHDTPEADLPDPELHACLYAVVAFAEDLLPRDVESRDSGSALLKRAKEALKRHEPHACIRCAATVRQKGDIEKAVRDALQATFEDRCEGCPGWAIFNESTGHPEIQRCDDCAPKHLTDDDVAWLVEAKVALCEAWIRVLDGYDGSPLRRIRSRMGVGWQLSVLRDESNGWTELLLSDPHGETIIRDHDPARVAAYLEGVEVGAKIGAL